MAITLNGTTGITTDGLTVDTTTLVVDEANNRVGIGTSSPATKLDVAGPASVTSFTGTTRLGVTVRGSSSTNDYSGIDIIGGNLTTPVARIASLTTGGGSTLSFGTSNSYGSGITNTAMTIDSSGNLLVGTTTRISNEKMAVKTSGDTWCISAQVTTNGNFGLAAINAAGSSVGGVIINASSTSYATSSDYRLKENVVGVTGAAARVQQLNPVRFNFIADPDRTVDGFLAHEVQDVVPEAITGTKDAVDAEGNPEYQGIDQSKLVPLLTAALQEALTKIETLEARVAALEAA